MEVDSWVVQSRCVTGMENTFILYMLLLFSHIRVALQRGNIGLSVGPRSRQLLDGLRPQIASDEVLFVLSNSVCQSRPSYAVIGQLCRAEKPGSACSIISLCMTTTECNTTNVFQDQLSESVLH